MNNTKLAALLMIGSGFAAACGNSQQQQAGMMSQAVSVTTAVVGEQMVSGTNSYPATVVALNETQLRAEVNGYITGIFVADGASVTKGQKLYEIDRTRYAAEAEQAKSNLAIAESNLARVGRDVARYQKLAQQDAIAKQTLDYAETDLSNAEAQVAAARAALTTAQTNLNRSTIVAPFSGTIGISEVRMGALVSAGSTLLNTISSTNPIAVDFQINESEIADFNALKNAGNAASDSIITVSLSGSRLYAHPGQITAIDRAVDRTTGTITVRASFPNPENMLLPGMNAAINIRRESASPQLVIPYQAVSEQLGQTSVYVVTDSSTVEQRGIHLGLRTAGGVVVTDGLAAGETVVTDGIINLRPGAKVQVSEPQGQQQ